MTEIRDRITNARGMGDFEPTYSPEEEQNGGGRSLTRLVREERCDECPWPDTCAADRTCWEEESTVANEAHAERRELQRAVGQVVEEGVKIRVRHELPEHAQRLLERMGATYIVDANAEPCAVACGQPECHREEQVMENEGAQALADMDEGVGQRARCKIEGCTSTTAVTRGRYAYLCVDHRVEAVGGGAATEPARAASNGAGGWAGKVRDLIPAAKRLDKAETKLAALPDSGSAKAELEEAMRRVQGASTAENLERLFAATKAMQSGKGPRDRAEKEHQAAAAEFKRALTALVRSAADA